MMSSPPPIEAGSRMSCFPCEWGVSEGLTFVTLSFSKHPYMFYPRCPVFSRYQFTPLLFSPLYSRSTLVAPNSLRQFHFFPLPRFPSVHHPTPGWQFRCKSPPIWFKNNSQFRLIPTQHLYDFTIHSSFLPVPDPLTGRLI